MDVNTLVFIPRGVAAVDTRRTWRCTSYRMRSSRGVCVNWCQDTSNACLPVLPEEVMGDSRPRCITLM